MVAGVAGAVAVVVRSHFGAGVITLALVAAVLLGRPAAAGAAPWLFVTDVHFDPADHNPKPSRYGSDTNTALLNATLAQMKRVDPDPPVVVIGGDYLAHHFDWKEASATMRYLAQRFDATFPHAQFVVALGNEDSPCGDYAVAPGSTFLRDAARAWAPLVDRNGAAPGFVTSFARDGFYTARLPVAHLRAVVINDVYWSPRYRECAATSENPANATVAELNAALHASRDRNWVVLHIPPGIDAYSTAHLVHHLVVVPFLDPAPRDALLRAVADPSADVALVVGAHTHKFAYRIAGTPARPIPILLVPAVSPIFDNAPGFLTADVDPDGSLRDVDDFAFTDGTWHDLGGLPSLGVTHLTGPALVDLQRRMLRDPALRARFAMLYEGRARSEIDAHNWPTYWCAATAFSATAFRACVDEGGVSIITKRGIIVAVAGVVAIGVLSAALIGWRRSRPTARRT